MKDRDEEFERERKRDREKKEEEDEINLKVLPLFKLSRSHSPIVSRIHETESAAVNKIQQQHFASLCIFVFSFSKLNENVKKRERER